MYMRWTLISEMSTAEGYRVYYNGPEDKHEQEVGIIVKKMITHSVLGCQAISSRIIYVRLKETPFNLSSKCMPPRIRL